MDKPENEQPMWDENPTDAELEARAEQMIREGRMPSLEELVEALIPAREEYIRVLTEEGAIPPGYNPPYGPVDVFQELVNARTHIQRAEPVSIGDYEQVRNELRDIIGPGS